VPLPADFDLKERVRDAVDIIDVIGAGLELRPAGRHFVARCPWHNDRRPSMTVNQERQTWKCWVCDIGGDVFNFVMQRDGVDFPTAVRQLAETAGIPIEQYSRGPKVEPGSPDDRDALLRALELVTAAYFEQLDHPKTDDARIARDYLDSRGISDRMRVEFRIGLAPDQWTYAVDHLAAQKIRADVAIAAGVASPRRSGDGCVDMFRGRLIFPILDLQNRPISMGGRVIPAIAQRHGDDVGGKYINGRETKLFRKSSTLYGLPNARDTIRREKVALVMEGYTDVIAAHQSGVTSALAVLGTALTAQHVQLLRRFTDRVVLVLDGDQAGQTRADEVLSLFVSSDINLRVLTLPDGADPADFITQSGREPFDQLVSQSPDALDHKLTRLTKGLDLSTDTHDVAKAADTMLKLMADVPDGLKIDQMIRRMSDRLQFKEERLLRRLDHFRTESKQKAKTFKRSTESTKSFPKTVASDPNDAFDLAVGEDLSMFDSSPYQGNTNQRNNGGTLGQWSSPAQRHVGLPTLMGIDRELFECLFQSPELASLAIEAIDPGWLDTTTAKMILSAYQDLDLAGKELTIDSLMTLVENEQLKNQIVTILDRIESRGHGFTETVQQRYNVVMTRYREREFAAEKDRAIEQLASAEMDEDAELEMLKRLFEQEKQRHRTP
jgi:DNA primase